MRYVVLSVTFILAAAGAVTLIVSPLGAPEHEPRGATAPASKEARVVAVIDGDTVRVRTDGLVESVRLLGVDAPELEFDDDTRTTKRECYAPESRAALADLVEGESVTMTPDPRNDDRDEYGRLLRYLTLPDGTPVNRELVERGAARHLSWFPLSRQDAFADAERAARAAGRGLWAVCN